MRTLAKDIVNYEGGEVTLMGWVHARRDHGKIIFIDLRDRSGIAQIVFTPKNKELYERAETMRPEWTVRVEGIVAKRPEGMENPELPTGKLEVKASGLEVFSEAETPPFDLSGDGYDIGEEVRMRYRYVDLRRPRLIKNLRNRAAALAFTREFFSSRDFIEVETPILGKSTPEGARDYLVPSRLHAGKFYALPQSPQQYKQLFMVAGLEQYFQIARCFRDEDTRGDRQPEFTQLDLEMSFVSREEILDLMEEFLLSLAHTLYPQKKLTLGSDGKIPRITYHESIEAYKTDRPDIRKNAADPDELAFLMITDFPMFEWSDTEKRWEAMQHPFTQPQVKSVEDFITKFKKDPASILSYQYDIVLNGYEIAGGSLRIYKPELLRAVFEAMGNKPDDVEEKFGHILRAFTYGAPPHGGIAFGFDRLIAILENEPNIREVIAFPKTGDGRDLMMQAPSEVDEKQLNELHIKAITNE